MNRLERGWSAFQVRHGLHPDGDPGRKTLRAVVALENDIDGMTVMRGLPPIPVSDYSYGGPGMKRDINRDPNKLIPAFASKLEMLFTIVREEGYDPYFWEGLRSKERAARLARKGTGIKMSMHCYGAAGDIVEADLTPWDVPRGFWDCISDTAESLKLVVLYRKGRRRDRPHVQALPVSAQGKFRRMTDKQRVEYIGNRLYK